MASNSLSIFDKSHFYNGQNLQTQFVENQDIILCFGEDSILLHLGQSAQRFFFERQLVATIKKIIATNTYIGNSFINYLL